MIGDLTQRDITVILFTLAVVAYIVALWYAWLWLKERIDGQWYNRQHIDPFEDPDDEAIINQRMADNKLLARVVCRARVYGEGEAA